MKLVMTIAGGVLLLALLIPAVERLLRSRPKLAALFRYGLLTAYGATYLRKTLLFRLHREEATAQLNLLSSYRRAFRLPDGWRSIFTGVEIESMWRLQELLLNILLYVPLGYLLPYVFPKMKGWQVLLAALCCSLLTEVLQMTLQIGWFEVDDLLNNGIGCLIGLGLYRLLIRRERRAP